MLIGVNIIGVYRRMFARARIVAAVYILAYLPIIGGSGNTCLSSGFLDALFSNEPIHKLGIGTAGMLANIGLNGS